MPRMNVASGLPAIVSSRGNPREYIQHLYSWTTLVRSRKDWPSLKTALCDNMNLAITLYRRESWTESRRSRRVGTHASAD